MQNENNQSTDDVINTTTTAAATAAAAPPAISTSSNNKNPFLSSPTSTQHFDYFYSSNSPSLTDSDDFAAFATADHHHQTTTGYILEYQQLYNKYTLCLAHLQESIKEVEALSHENESLRLVNSDLDHRLSLLTQATIQNCLLSDFNRLGLGPIPEPSRPPNLLLNRAPNLRPGVVTEPNIRPERRNVERVTLPKSISVRSSGYLKLKGQGGKNTEGPSLEKTKQKAANLPLSEAQRVYVPGGKKEEEALEFEVYNQGMFKTELCNKWQETGECPYKENCQFAHGITELRPVIRHPRYKTEVCRMVLAGDICPYGHRCHFRHTLTEEERRTGALF